MSACGNPGQFKGGIASKTNDDANSEASKKLIEAEETLSPLQAFRYDLIVADGKPVVRQGLNPSSTAIYKDDTDVPLDGAGAAAWQVTIKPGSAPETVGALGARELDLSAASGIVTISAKFQHRDGRSGQVSRSVYVDSEAPKASLVELSTSAAGDQRVLYWAATDNYQVRTERTRIYACIKDTAPVIAKSFDDLNQLQPNCAIAAKAEDLVAAGDQITLGSLTIEGQDYLPSQLVHYIFAEDLVGQSTSVIMTPAARNVALLVLDSSIKGIQFTNKSVFNYPLTLTLIDQGQSQRIDAMASSWDKYGLSQARVPENLSTNTVFDPAAKLTLGTAEGLYTFTLQAQQIGQNLLSNEKTAAVVYDKTPPLVTSTQIQVPGGYLDQTADVSITWNATDVNGIQSQVLEYQSKGDATWTKIADLAGTARSYVFIWDNRPQKGFTVRVSATDPAGNTGSEVSPPWAPQIFNAAVLTSSVECFYCHMRIEGDVGGINFPSDAVMDARADSGEQFRILGKLFATNNVPQLFKRQIAAGQMTVSGGLVDNYDNSGIKIFPSQKDAKGVPVFPALSVALLKDRMNGTVVNGSGVRYSRIYQGNLVLSGTAANPIQLSGEFLVDGDLVIEGVYKGIGSIYAKNVYIVDDIVSIDCIPGATTCPFPFAGTTDDEKLASAKSAIKLKRAALYLAGIGQTNVGGISTSWDFALADPYSWLPKASYQSYCTQGAYLKTSSGANFATPNQFYDPTLASDVRARCEVSRVDAFIYGHDLITWRSYGNYLINGGFVGYKAALLSTVPYRIYHNGAPATIPINSRNNMPADQNVIRYDWRLRAGGAGFESLKLLFDQ